MTCQTELANAQDEERDVARLLNPFDGPGPRRPKKLVDGALRSLGDGPPAGGPSSYSKVLFITTLPEGFIWKRSTDPLPFLAEIWFVKPLRFFVTYYK